MNYGQLISTTSRKEHSCVECKEPIESGTYMANIRYHNVGPMKRSFINRFHWKCLEPYCTSQDKVRQEKVEAERRERGDRHRGRPRLDLDLEARKRRHNLQQYMFVAKNALFIHYLKGNMKGVENGWNRVSYLIEQYVTQELGPLPSSMEFGNEIGNLILEKTPELYGLLASSRKDPAMIRASIRTWLATKENSSEGAEEVLG